MREPMRANQEADTNLVDITLTTPALLFPAISLLLVAYTNRFLAIGSRVRSLHAEYRNHHDDALKAQIDILRHRLILIRNMQACGVLSLFSCVVCMFSLFAGKIFFGKIIFGISLILLLTSLAISFREISISIRALNLQLSDLSKPLD